MVIFYSFLIGVGLSIITVFADSLVKHASLQTAFSGWKWLITGAVIYGSTALGWFFVFRKIKFSSAAVLYSVGLILFTVIMSIFYFKEKISPVEFLGIGMAVASLIILARFA